MKTKTVYIANDGKEFTNQEDCKKWEQSKTLREDLAYAWYKDKGQAVQAWVQHVALILIKDYHIVKKNEQTPVYLKKSGQTSNQSDDNRS